MAKSKSTAASAAAIAKRPVLYFRGAPQTQEFTQAALRMRDLIAAICTTPLPNQGSAYDEIAIAERFTYLVLEMFNGDEDSKRGAAAALAHWIVAAENGEGEASEWTPLAPGPVYRCSETDDDEWHEPAPGSQFFSVAGEPVSIGPELVAYAWGRKPEYRDLAIDLVRVAGKPISAKRFDELRRSFSTGE